MRSWLRFVGWCVVALAVGACLSACTDATPAAREIRVGYAGALDVGDASAEMAHAALEVDGYTVLNRSFATIEALVDALARGDVDVATGAARAFWAASARGAEVKTVMEHVANVHRLVVRGKPADCVAALHERRLALQSEGAAGTALARAYMAERCADARPEILMVPGSPNRMAAALSGAIDATVLQLSDVARLERLSPGTFSIFGDFAREWPALMVTGVHVNSRVARERPRLIRDYVRARVLANRRAVTNRAEILRYAGRILGDEDDWTEETATYARMPAWRSDGGLTRQGVADTLAFLTERSGLDRTLTAERVADLTFLESVLEELHAGTVSP